MSYTTLPIDQRYFNFRCRMVGPFLERAAVLPTIRGKSNQIGDMNHRYESIYSQKMESVVSLLTYHHDDV